MSNVIYGTEISDEQLIQYMDEISNETLIPTEDLVNASGPLTNQLKEEFYLDGLIDSGLPSNVPIKIDKLNKFHSNQDKTISEEIVPILLLKNTMDTNIKISGSYNGVCVDLDTTGFNLIIDSGCSVAAL